MVMRGDTLGEKEMNYTERAEAVNDNDVEDEGMVDGSETKDNPAPSMATGAVASGLFMRDLATMRQKTKMRKMKSLKKMGWRRRIELTM